MPVKTTHAWTCKKVMFEGSTRYISQKAGRIWIDHEKECDCGLDATVEKLNWADQHKCAPAPQPTVDEFIVWLKKDRDMGTLAAGLENQLAAYRRREGVGAPCG